ncbi:MAG: FxsA family protein [Candidatus Puniceispirillaceae bacterium]
MALYGIIAFVIYGWVEFEAMAHVVDAIGGLLAFLGIFVTAIIGIRLLRSQSAIVMASFRADLAKGQMNSHAIASSLSLLAGAILMLIPGYVTDVLGLLCFMPGLRAIIGNYIARHFSARAMAGMSRNFSGGFRSGGFGQNQSQDHPFSAPKSMPDEPGQARGGISEGDDIIEGQFTEKK